MFVVNIFKTKYTIFGLMGYWFMFVVGLIMLLETFSGGFDMSTWSIRALGLFLWLVMFNLILICYNSIYLKIDEMKVKE